MWGQFWGWLDDRSGIRTMLHALLYERLPRKIGWLHVLGSGALFLFILQVLTGILLAMNYVPSTSEAYESVQYITKEAPFGKVVRGLHYWGASLMVIVVVLHMLRVFTMGAYKKPRELTWMVGVMLFVLTLGFAFTGYLLPYDQKAYWATKVGVSFVGYVPFVGEHLKRLLYGGEELGAPTLTRFYAIHALVLPMLTIPLIAFHLMLMRRKGEMPPGVEAGAEAQVEKPLTFYPHQVWKDLVFAGALLALLFLLTLHWGVHTEPPADPTDTTYLPRPEWYFLPLFQLEKVQIGKVVLFGGARVWLGTVLIPMLFVALLFALPFLDRNPSRHPRRRPLMMLGAGILLALTVWLGVDAKVETDRARARLARQHPAPRFTGLAGIGQQLVMDRYLRCHRVDGKGSRKAPEFVRLAPNELPHWTKDQLILYLMNPQETHPGTVMPTAKELGLTSLDQLEAVAEYILHYKPIPRKPLRTGSSFGVARPRGE